MNITAIELKNPKPRTTKIHVGISFWPLSLAITMANPTHNKAKNIAMPSIGNA